MSESFNVSFSLDDARIKLKPAASLSELSRLEESVGSPLPPSFRWWLSQYEEAVFDIGNLLKIDSPFAVDNGFSIASQSEWYRNNPECRLKDLIVFGMNGVDSETWAFYTGVYDEDGEYPIIWISPGSLDSTAYVFANTRFDRFLNCQVNFLLAVDREDIDDGQAGAELNALYQRHEPVHRLKTSSFYRIAVDAETLRHQLSAFYSKDVR